MTDDDRPSLRRGTWRREPPDRERHMALIEKYLADDRRKREAIRAEGGGVVIPFRPRA